MKISEVQIHPVKPQDGLIAFASCVINDSYYIGSIGVFTRLSGGYRLVYPTKKVGNRNINLHHPINEEARLVIEEAIAMKLQELYGDDFFSHDLPNKPCSL